MKKTYDFLKKCGTFYIATVDCDTPRVRPFGALDIFENKMYIQTGRKKPFFEQVMRNPAIEICAFDGETWLRLSAKVTDDNRIIAKEHMLDANPTLRALYDANDDNTRVLYLHDAHAVFSSFSAPTETEEF